MSLSVCLITKNEQDNLERALSSVEPVADEIIITDTGSTDNTISIAESFGAKISNFDWCDDFSAARNYNFSQAECDWIFWIDADEELLPESADELKRCLSREDVFTYLILRQDIRDVSRLDLYSEMWVPRLFRRHDNINFVGRIHEHFHPDVVKDDSGRPKLVEPSQIRIRHYGFIAPKQKEKYRRDAKLLELELQDRPGQLYYQVELYRTLMLIGDNRWKGSLNEAAANLFQHINSDVPPSPQAALLIETLLQLSESRLPKGFSKTKLRELANKWFPRAAPLIWVLAKQDYEKGRFEQAEHRLRLLIQMGKEHSYELSTGFDPHIFDKEAQLNLAVCLIRQAKLKEAQQILESLTESPEHRLAAEQNLNAIKRIRLGLSPKGRRKRRR
jgi:glycosyltransferase involved in cell wall biosynthesis